MKDWLRRKWPLLVVLLSAAIWFYRSPYSAANLEIVPDSEEYAIGALELLDTGHFEITVEGRPVPSRYPPWFSAVALLPSYALFGHNPGNGVLAVTALAVAGIACAWAIGRKIAGAPGAMLAALAVLVIPSYSIRAGQIMTDVPCTAMSLGGALLYLRAQERPRSLRPYVAAGILIALTALFRTLFGALLLPFLYSAIRSRNRVARRMLALLLPVALAATATLIYNAATFGSPLRNGYHLWTPVPSDYFWLTFSFSNIPPSLTVLWNSPLPIFAAIALIASVVLRFRRTRLPAERRTALRNTLTFFALPVLLISAFHLLYFYRSDRFYLPLFVAVAILAATTAALALGAAAAKITRWLPVPALLLAFAGRMMNPEATQHRWLAARRISRFTPPNATVISAIDSVYLDRFAAQGSQRRIVPLSRRVEYASKVLAWRRVPKLEPPPRSARDPDQYALLRGGAEPAVQFVASEQIDGIAEQVARGAAVYLDTTMVDDNDERIVAELSRRCRLQQRAAYLFELQAR